MAYGIICIILKIGIYIYHAGWNDANHQIDVANLQNFVDQMIKLMYHQSSEY